MGADGDLYGNGKPLRGEGLFQIAAEEVFRDGEVAPAENAVLRDLAMSLGLEPERAREIASLAKRKFKAGKLGERRSFDAETLHRRAMAQAAADGQVDEKEARLLAKLRELLQLSEPAPGGSAERASTAMPCATVGAKKPDQPTAPQPDEAPGLRGVPVAQIPPRDRPPVARATPGSPNRQETPAGPDRVPAAAPGPRPVRVAAVPRAGSEDPGFGRLWAQLIPPLVLAAGATPPILCLRRLLRHGLSNYRPEHTGTILALFGAALVLALGAFFSVRLRTRLARAVPRSLAELRVGEYVRVSGVATCSTDSAVVVPWTSQPGIFYEFKPNNYLHVGQT
ncbi:MAG: hypothetical protein HY814_06940, partial [Candidatus Riflebacteria bacterium]|nr:hypothetical protein [Candidatus Riflebacteria bacterium]